MTTPKAWLDYATRALLRPKPDHTHSWALIDSTIFAESYAQPGVLVCLECGRKKAGDVTIPMLHDLLARYLWDCGVAAGMDTDGDTGPEALIAGMGYDDFAQAMLDHVKQLRADYQEEIG